MNEYSTTGVPEKSTQTDLIPNSIEREGVDWIVIRWSDGKISRWKIGDLRNACPCATCREKNRGKAEKEDSATKGGLPLLPVLSPQEARPLAIESMRPVGSYAYNIAFSDGHSSGIFPFKLLHDH